MEALVPVALFDMPALGAPLAGIGRVNLDYPAASPGRLVLELLAQVVEGPADTDIAVFGAHPFRGGANTSQILQHKQGAFRVVFHEFLRHAMVDVVYPTVFS